MKRFSRLIAIVLSLICLSCISTGLTACKSDYSNVVTLSDNGAKLTNPNMGWNFTYYANTVYDFNNTLVEGDFLDDFPCDIAFFRIGWNWIEPVEGQFNFDFIDEIAKDWISRGKRIALCFVVTFIGDQSTPLWVRDAGAEGHQYYWRPKITGYDQDTGEPIYLENEYDDYLGARKLYLSYVNDNGKMTNVSNMSFSGVPVDAQEYARNVNVSNQKYNRFDSNYNGGQEVEVGDFMNYRGSWVPKYDDPVFLAKWRTFINKCAEHYESEDFNYKYDKNPDLDVDFVEIGSFGDWGEAHNSYSKLNTINKNIAQTHIDNYACFKKIQVMYNDSIPDKYGELVQYALDRNIGVSDHTVQVPNGSAEGYTANSAVAREFYQQQPVLLENHNGTQIMETYYNGVVDCYATWARINCNPNTCAFSEWTDKITLRLGYRLNFTEVAFDEIKGDGKVKFQFKMKNNGTAYCYDGGNPTAYIVDSLGRVICSAISDFDVKELKPNRKQSKVEEYTATAEMQVPAKKMLPGTYYVCVSVTKPDEKGKAVDTYKLALDHQDGERLRYRIAKFVIEE